MKAAGAEIQCGIDLDVRGSQGPAVICIDVRKNGKDYTMGIKPHVALLEEKTSPKPPKFK